MIGEPELKKRFTHHPPKDDQVIRYEMIRNRAHELAAFIDVECPDSREKSLAITHVEGAVMWANAAIARNELWPIMTPPRSGGS
jgi:hypothetical protein